MTKIVTFSEIPNGNKKATLKKVAAINPNYV
jgi:hypothetical protein